MKIAIVTAASANLGPLISDWVAAIRSFPQSGSVDLGILDVGLDPAQVAEFNRLGVKVVEAGWDVPQVKPPAVPVWYRAFTARPHLPKYFPDCDLIVWLDCDSWLARWEVVDLLTRTAAGGKIALVPELDRAYGHCFAGRPQVTQLMADLYGVGWGAILAEKLMHLPVLNSGAFALRTDSPTWALWQKAAHDGFQRMTHMLVEQTALNVAIYAGGAPAHFLPSWCNWMCNKAFPVLDPATRTLLHPLEPREPLGLIHLSETKGFKISLECPDGTFRHLTPTYSAITRDPLPEPSPNRREPEKLL